MKYSIGKMISKSIKENKWLSIDYVNKDNQESSFWCSVLDIDIENKTFSVDIFNIFKGNKILNEVSFFDERINELGLLIKDNKLDKDNLEELNIHK